MLASKKQASFSFCCQNPRGELIISLSVGCHDPEKLIPRKLRPLDFVKKKIYIVKEKGIYGFLNGLNESSNFLKETDKRYTTENVKLTIQSAQIL